MTFFHEYLDEAQRPTKWQINMSTMDDEQREIAAYIVGNLDENGYLDVPLAEISEALGCSEEKVQETLHLVQHLDPVGVAARDMWECLLIQASFQNLGGTIVEKIIAKHLKDLEYKRYDLIAKRLSAQGRWNNGLGIGHAWGKLGL